MKDMPVRLQKLTLLSNYAGSFWQRLQQPFTLLANLPYAWVSREQFTRLV